MHRRRLLAALASAGALLVLPARPAAAHPTDEILQQVYVTPSSRALAVRVDVTPGVLVAPAFAARLDADGDGALGTAELDAEAAALVRALSVIVDGAPVAVTLATRSAPALELLAAGGGTLTVVVSAPLPAGASGVAVTNGYDPGRGTVQADALVAADGSPAPAAVAHADGGRTITLSFGDTAPAGPAVADAASSVPPMLAALERPLRSPWALLALLGSCAALGALHALTPGHGKTMLAAYLVGERGTVGQAITLGTVVTVTHTSSVVALGVAVLVAGHWIVPGVVVPTVELVTGLAVLLLGLRLVRSRRRSAGAADHHHPHDHGHDHDGHHYHHHPTVGLGGGARGLVTMGVSGGIVPCPEALGVLLLAVGLHRTAMGLGMIVAFSAGLAAVLVTLGVVLVRARAVADRVGALGRRRAAAWVPIASAVIVTVLGGVMAARGIGALAAR